MHSYSFDDIDLGRHLGILFVTRDKPCEVFVLEALIAASNSAYVGGVAKIAVNSRSKAAVMGCTIASQRMSSSSRGTFVTA